MNRFLTATAILVAALIILVVPGSALAQVQGQVVDAAGAPIAGVEMWVPTGVPGGPLAPSPTTDDNGHFTLERGEVIRFVKPGYRPVTRLRSDVIANPVVRMQSPPDTWQAPRCPSQADSRIKTMTGAAMRFVLPGRTRARQESDADYSLNLLCIKGGCLRHGWGAMWSTGIKMFDLDASYFAGVREMTERDVYDVPHDAAWGAEYRGVRTDGTSFRWVGVLNETIEYDHASKSAADVFDKLLDSLCWLK